jgi:murein L,D-transpeptidase YafK
LLLAFVVATPMALADGASAPSSQPSSQSEVEAALVRAIMLLRESGLKSALAEIEQIVSKAPNFRLGHLIKGDILMAYSGNPVAFGPVSSTASGIAPLQHEARVRLQRFLDAPPPDFLPQPLLQLSAWQEHAVLIDTSRSRLYVFANDNGRPRYVTDFYISVGKNGVDKQREGDQRTPIGAYTITSSKEKLPDFYGAGAFPISYPNDWDVRHGRNGHGIWLHGTPSETYSRPPLATDGCVVLTNDDLARLTRYVDVGRTPVVISHRIDWQAPERWNLDRATFMASFEKWRADWESNQVDAYLGHYSPRFSSDGKGLAAWTAHKRKVAAGKSWIKVSVPTMSAVAYPGVDTEMMMVTFEQDYRSNNLSNRTFKRQYWIREGDAWRILHESVIS